MKISREDKFIGGSILIIILLIVGWVFWNGYKNDQIAKEAGKRAASEERIKQLQKEFDIRDNEIKALVEEKGKLQAVLEYQKNNPNIIIKKYETIHNSVDALSNSKQFELFSIALYDYRNNKERYSISRFKRGN